MALLNMQILITPPPRQLLSSVPPYQTFARHPVSGFALSFPPGNFAVTLPGWGHLIAGFKGPFGTAGCHRTEGHDGS